MSITGSTGGVGSGTVWETPQLIPPWPSSPVVTCRVSLPSAAIVQRSVRNEPAGERRKRIRLPSGDQVWLPSEDGPLVSCCSLVPSMSMV